MIFESLKDLVHCSRTAISDAVFLSKTILVVIENAKFSKEVRHSEIYNFF